MMLNTDLVNIIFGMKVRQARLETALNLSEFARCCDLSPSYITEIEKGRKYPKTDKILKMAEVLGKSYDDLVSIKLGPSLAHLENMLSSQFLQQFPFEAFDLDLSDLVQLLTRTPDKASALLHAIYEIGRQYDMKEEHFLRAALRSYQEIHENYFQDLEDAAAKFAQDFGIANNLLLDHVALEKIIREKFGYELDFTRLANYKHLANYRSVFVGGAKPKLLINSSLYPNQIKFILARELGYQVLSLKERSNTSAPDQVGSFEQVLNDFKASYFAGALLIQKAAILEDLQTFFEMRTWEGAMLLDMLAKYDVTPEMLLYRFSELIPQFFGIKMHFLRFHEENGQYRLVKHFNMNQLPLPSGIGLSEHYCRRWAAVRLLRKMDKSKPDPKAPPLVGVQISEFLNSHDRFLAFGFARPLALSLGVGSSVSVGFRLEPTLKDTIHFVDDPTIPNVMIHETCERCPLTHEQCDERGAEASIMLAEKQQAKRRASLDQLMGELQN